MNFYKLLYKSKQVLIRKKLSLFFFLTLSLMFSSSSYSMPIGVVTDVTGNAVIQRGLIEVTPINGTELFDKDIIETNNGTMNFDLFSDLSVPMSTLASAPASAATSSFAAQIEARIAARKSRKSSPNNMNKDINLDAKKGTFKTFNLRSLTPQVFFVKIPSAAGVRGRACTNCPGGIEEEWIITFDPISELTSISVISGSLTTFSSPIFANLPDAFFTDPTDKSINTFSFDAVYDATDEFNNFNDLTQVNELFNVTGGHYTTAGADGVFSAPQVGLAPAHVPEPSVLLLFSLGLLLLSLPSWRARVNNL